MQRASVPGGKIECKVGRMSCDIDEHITAKYDIKKRIGKGVGDFVS